MQSLWKIAREYELVDFICPSCKRREQKKLDVGIDKKVKCPECKNTFFLIENSSPYFFCEKCKSIQ
jgi:ribosomal protein L37AE/L43A